MEETGIFSNSSLYQITPAANFREPHVKLQINNNNKEDMIVNTRGDIIMNKKSKTPLWGKLLLILASLVLCVGMSTTQALAVSYDSTGNNFTMVAPDATLTGGTNDVHFTWDGTMKTSVAVSGQVSNATISSTCAFSGFTWRAHDVAIYGPGIYTVNPCCPSGSPGCATTCLTSDTQFNIPPITFTVGAGERGGHMLFNWSINSNIDVIDIWAPTQMFAPSPLFDGTSPGGCSSNLASKVWDLMSKDWGSCSTLYTDLNTLNEACLGVADGVTDNLNGAPMVDGPFNEQNANFNVMLVPVGCLTTQPTSTTPCIEWHCNTTTQQWTPTNTTAPCDADNNLCTANDTCSNGICVAGPAPNCDDGIACTVDSCDPAIGCVNDKTHCNPPSIPTLISPADGSTGQFTTLELRWTRSTDPAGDPITYHITYCKTPNAAGCASVADVKDSTLAKRDSKGMFYAGGAGLLMIGMTFIGGFTGRKKIVALLIIVVLFSGGAFMSCKNTKNVDTGTPLGSNEVNYMAQPLDPGTTYYWKIEADNGFGMITSSVTSTEPVRSFTTQ
jgi:hypothetical protein